MFGDYNMRRIFGQKLLSILWLVNLSFTLPAEYHKNSRELQNFCQLLIDLHKLSVCMCVCVCLCVFVAVANFYGLFSLGLLRAKNDFSVSFFGKCKKIIE